MDLTEYRNRHRRPIVLPSGLRGFVRAPSVLDLAGYPALLAASLRGGAQERDTASEWVHLVLRRCFIPERGIMCEKEPGQCLPGELSVHEIAPADAAALLEAVSALGGERADPEAAPAGGAFPAGEAEAAGGAPRAGEGVRPAAPPAGGVHVGGDPAGLGGA